MKSIFGGLGGLRWRAGGDKLAKKGKEEPGEVNPVAFAGFKDGDVDVLLG